MKLKPIKKFTVTKSCRLTVALIQKLFTIIELLMVIAIITILATILLPTLNRAKETSKKIVCANNLKQYYFAYQGYIEDYGGWIPLTALPSPCPLSKFTDFWQPYCNLASIEEIQAGCYRTKPSMLICPADKIPQEAWGEPWLSYGANEKIGHPTIASIGWRKITEFTKPSLGLMISESDDQVIYPAGSYRAAIEYQHFLGNNICFLDGSVSWTPKTKDPDTFDSPWAGAFWSGK